MEVEAGHREVEKSLYHRTFDHLFFIYRSADSQLQTDQDAIEGSSVGSSVGTTGATGDAGGAGANDGLDTNGSSSKNAGMSTVTSATSGIVGSSSTTSAADTGTNLDVTGIIDTELEIDFYKRMICDEDPFPYSVPYHIYSLHVQTPKQLLPPISPRSHPAGFYACPEKISGENYFIFNNEIFYLSAGNLEAYSIPFNTYSSAKELCKALDKGPIWSNRLVHSEHNNAFIVFFEEHTKEPGTSNILPG